MSDKRAALFDLDGTLVDSMWVWDRLLIDFLDRHGFETPPHVLNQVAYMSLTQSSAYVRKEFGLSVTPEEIRQEWTDMVYEAYSQKIGLKPGAEEYLHELKEQGVRLGVATSCDRALCEACLKNNGIYDMFDVYTYADEVGKGKSSPDIYLECLRRLDCPAEDSVLFEDILTALRTAKAIGMKVVIVEDASAEPDRAALKAEADLYIRDFRALL